jgi:hypothetical protein
LLVVEPSRSRTNEPGTDTSPANVGFFKMSDTRRKNHFYPKLTMRTWFSFGVSRYPEQEIRANRDDKLAEKGADGKNTKKTVWRFESAREDGSGKLNTFDETGFKRRDNRKLKRQASKDTRRIGKKIIKRDTDDFRT